MKHNHRSCNANMTFEECELAILRSAVDQAGERQAKKVVNSPEVQKMIKIVKHFYVRNSLFAMVELPSAFFQNKISFTAKKLI